MTHTEDPPTWRDRSDERRQRADSRRRVVLAIAVAVVAAGAAAFVFTRPDPPAELTEASRAFAGDWPSMSVDDLCTTWFTPSLTESKKQKLERIFARRDWLERRPAIRYVLDEMRADERKGRSEYEIEGFPKERRLKVFWNRVNGRWRVSMPTIPVLKDE